MAPKTPRATELAERSNSQLSAHQKAGAGGFFHLFISLFFSPPCETPVGACFSFPLLLRGVRACLVFFHVPAKDGRVWPRAAAATGGETIWMRATQNRRGTDGGSAAQKVGARLQRSSMGLFLFFFFFRFAKSANPQSAFTSAGGGRQQGDGGTKYNIGFNATSPEGLFHIYVTLRKPIENVQKRGRPRDWTSLLSVTFKLTFEKRFHILKKIIHFFKSIKHLPS